MAKKTYRPILTPEGPRQSEYANRTNQAYLEYSQKSKPAPTYVQPAPATPRPVASPDQAAKAKIRNSAAPALTNNIARRGLPTTTRIDPNVQARNTAKLLEELKGPQGGVASGIAGGVTGFVGAGKKSMAPEVQQTIESSPGLNRAFTGGQIAGTALQFAVPYAAASKPISALPGVANVGGKIGRGLGAIAPKLGSEVAQKIGRGIAGSVATDLTVGLPLNVNQAYNAEGLRGADALKNIALNTGIDLATGGLIEAAPAAVKLLRKADTKIPVVQPNGNTRFQNAAVPGRELARNIPAPAPRVVPQKIGRGLGQVEPMVNAPAWEAKRSFNPTRKGLAQVPDEGPYFRGTSSSTKPVSDWGHAMFVDKKERAYFGDGSSNYGWTYDGKNSVRIEDLQDEIARLWDEQRMDGFPSSITDDRYYEKLTGDEVAKLLNPDDIVDTAAGWDDGDITQWMWEEILEPRGIKALTTNDGAIVFDPEMIKPYKEAKSFSGRPKQLRHRPLNVPNVNGQNVTKLNSKLHNSNAQKALYQTAIDEYDKTVASVADYISNYKPKGVDVGVIPKNGDELMRDGGIRYSASKNDLWYQDFYKQYGRKPTKAEATEIADRLVKESLRTGSGEFHNPRLNELLDEIRGLQDKGFKSLGADTARMEKTIDELIKEYGAFPKGEAPRAREVDVPKKTDYGDVQQHVRTLQESGAVDDTLFNGINDELESFTKATKGNRVAVENANSFLESNGLDNAFDRFRSVLRSDKQATSDDLALGYRVMQELQKEGRYGDALDVAIDLSEMLSETGRTLQAARIVKRLSPEGRLMIATRAADKVSKKTGTKVKLSDETVKLISDAKTEKEVVEANQKAAKEIWDQVPARWIDKVNSWRYMSMLTNPKTHIRNIVGNALFVPAREFKNLIGAGLERRYIKDGERTKAVLNPIKDKEIMEFARSDFDNVKSILKNEGKLDTSVRNIDAKVFDNKALEALRNLNMNALDAEDTIFMKYAYDSSLAQYMKANRINPADMVGETLEKGRKYAMNEALKATYRDFNALSNLISKGKAAGASGEKGVLGRAGSLVLEGLVPFSKTPLNIVKRGVGYSPANIVRGIINMTYGVKSGKVAATEAIDQLASGLSGSAILGLGAALGYMGLVTGKDGEYKDKLYNYNQMLGSQNYSLNIDGKSYTLDWAAPLSMPFFVGVELSKAAKDNNSSLWSVLDAMTQISDPMVNLSMLKGINDILTNNFEGLGQTAMDISTGYAGQFVPTVGGQIARTLDGTRRSTISTAENQTQRGLEKFGRKQLAKVPGASQNLEPYVDLWGREQKSGNIIENFLSPGYFKQSNITPVDKELRSLMKGLDEEGVRKILPTSTAYQYTLTADKQTYRMTEKESTKYQKIRGEESYKGLQKLFASGKYKSMDADEKVKAIEDIYKDAHDTAKMEILSTRGVSHTVLLSKPQRAKYEQYGKNLGLDEEKFVDLMKNVSSIEGKKRNGKTIDGSESRNKKKYIDEQFPDATREQKWFLYAMAGVSGNIGHYTSYKNRFDKKE